MQARLRLWRGWASDDVCIATHCNALQHVVLSCDVVWAARQGRTSAQPPMPLFVADNERRHRHARLVCTQRASLTTQRPQTSDGIAWTLSGKGIHGIQPS
jgi:hypothetical protein